jgi:tetratricopeptide (TPR) repeat protein
MASVGLAQPRTRQGNANEAAASARRALANDPLDVDALRDLGLTLAATKGSEAADPVMDAAARLTRRDTVLAAWLMRRRLQQGRPAEALEQADSLLRRDIDPALRARLENVLILAAGDETLRRPLAERLAAGPPWRAAFIRRLIAVDPAAADALTSPRRR